MTLKHLSVFSFFLFHFSFSQDTFSIVAVDTVTREIGSAGASCVGPINGVGAFILSDVIEGVGAIHTQASWLSANQVNARQRMLLNESPQQIISWLVANDAQGNPTTRQYGIVDLRRNGESAAYTGVNCLDYKNHAIGAGYAVQGNILLGQVIIDTIRNTFLRTPGPLADRLMRALEAAKIIGADTRCASRNTSSQSGFVKVVRIGDGARPYLQHIVPTTASGVEPIDSLRRMFNRWKDSLRTKVDPFLSRLQTDRDTLLANGASQAVITIIPRNNSDTLLASGRTILLSRTGAGTLSVVTDLGNGTYVAAITAPSAVGTDTISARVVFGSDTVRIAQKKVLRYRAATSVVQEVESLNEFALEQNYPNPFNPTTNFGFRLPAEVRRRPTQAGIADFGFVTLTIYDVLGREVATVVHESLDKGSYLRRFDASRLAGGVYYYQLRAGNFFATRRMVLLK
jgi:uncharacterized Ntn-hydrolase superfamily protein